MATQVVISRIQNRRGKKSEFNQLYAEPILVIDPRIDPPNPVAPPEYLEQQLQPGEIGLCIDTGEVFIGLKPGLPPVPPAPEYRYAVIGVSSGDPADNKIEFTPTQILLSQFPPPPPPDEWTGIPQLMYEPVSDTASVGVLDILYSLHLDGETYSRNGTLTVTSVDTTATLVDSSTEYRPAALTGDVSFTALVTGGWVQIQYMNTFAQEVLMKTSTIRWAPI